MITLDRQSRTLPESCSANVCERIAAEIGAFALVRLERMAVAYFPGWRIPGIFAGYAIGSDVSADAAFTLSLLHELGHVRIAGGDISNAIGAVLRQVDGRRTDTFWSYRVAESLRPFGSFERNSIMAGWSDDERKNIAVACDSTDRLPELEAGRLPRNYAAVLARCEWARTGLGMIPPNSTLLESLIARTRDLLRENPHGYLDDCGTARYDIYTADLYLFSEPYAGELAPYWQHGVRNVIRLVEKTVSADGSAFPWGRSSGALAACMTVELGALALRDGLCGEPGRWLTLIKTAFDSIKEWFSDSGLISAHRYRSTYRYRGVHRLLQMTLDCLGKLAWSAVALRDAAAVVRAPAATLAEAFPEQDEFVYFDQERKAGIWCYRSRNGLAFGLPVLGPTLNDYLPAPRSPHLFEIPVEAELPCGVPVAYLGGKRFVGGFVPVEIEKLPRGIRLHYDGYPLAGQWSVSHSTPGLPGRRIVTYRVEGRTLAVDEDLRFGRRPAALGIQIAETLGRPLSVDFECDSDHSVASIATAGMKEYRSFWSELPRVHQLDLQPSDQIRFHYRLKPLIRVASSHRNHPYHRTIYDQLSASVVDSTTMPECHRNAANFSLQEHRDVYHLHWPEHISRDLEVHREIIAGLAAASVPVVWTQHNLEPHKKDHNSAAIFAAWAGAARGVVHHSYWGQTQSAARCSFRPDAVHRVIPHPSFGAGGSRDPLSDRMSVEAELGLEPGRLRLGVFGAPRKEKRLDILIRAFLRCRREDVELVIFSMPPGAPRLQHPRVVADPYHFVPDRTYRARLNAVDVVVLPFDDGMLTTGVVGDVVGHGLPALISDWPYLVETLGDAAICAGRSEDDFVRAIESLSWDAVERARSACRQLQERYAPARIAAMTADLLETVIEMGA